MQVTYQNGKAFIELDGVQIFNMPLPTIEETLKTNTLQKQIIARQLVSESGAIEHYSLTVDQAEILVRHVTSAVGPGRRAILTIGGPGKLPRGIIVHQ